MQRRIVVDKRQLDADLEALRNRLRSMRPLKTVDNDARTKRRQDSIENYDTFVANYFPHVTEHKPSDFHNWIAKQSQNLIAPAARNAIAAPRGNAKTTHLARILVLWALARGKHKNIVQISDALEIAESNVEAIKIELEENPRLAEDFPGLCGIGDRWREGEIITKNGIKLKAYGSGKRIRGANHAGSRPDLIIIDDLENDENVASKRQRDKLYNWFTSAVLKLGPPDGSAAYLYVGTVLHYDSVLRRVGARADFKWQRFQAIVRFPDNMRLWDEWEQWYLADEQAGREFYQTNKKAMDAGARVLWPNVQPLYLLMCERASDRKAFNTEMQNDPNDAATAIFIRDKIHYTKNYPPSPIVQTVAAVDPAMGKTRGDYAALIVLGKRADGRVQVLECQLLRKHPSLQIESAIELQRQFGASHWYVEIVAFQEFYKDIMLEKSLIAKVPLPIVGVRLANKEIRIESLAPHIENGIILFEEDQTMLIDQLCEYPNAANDDGPDALHVAFSHIYRTTRIEYQSAPNKGVNTLRLPRLRGKGY